jgi:transposase
MYITNLVVHKYKIEERRRRVASMLAQSMTETEIAKKLKVDQSSISRDIKVLKKGLDCNYSQRRLFS